MQANEQQCAKRNPSLLARVSLKDLAQRLLLRQPGIDLLSLSVPIGHLVSMSITNFVLTIVNDFVSSTRVPLILIPAIASVLRWDVASTLGHPIANNTCIIVDLILPVKL